MKRARSALIGHGAQVRLIVFERDHVDRVPGTTIQKGSFRPFTDTKLATDAQQPVDFYSSEGRMFFVRHPNHTVPYGAVVHTGRGAGTARTGVIDDSDHNRFALTLLRFFDG